MSQATIEQPLEEINQSLTVRSSTQPSNRSSLAEGSMSPTSQLRLKQRVEQFQQHMDHLSSLEQSSLVLEAQQRRFVGCLPLIAGVRTQGGLAVFGIVLFSVLAGVVNNYWQTQLVLGLYAVVVYVPLLVAHILMEVREDGLQPRRLVMRMAWYAVTAALVMDIVLIGYNELYLNCTTSFRWTHCKANLGRQLFVVLLLTVVQGAAQAYLAMVCTWYHQQYRLDYNLLIEKQRRKVMSQQMKRALTGDFDGRSDGGRAGSQQALVESEDSIERVQFSRPTF